MREAVKFVSRFYVFSDLIELVKEKKENQSSREGGLHVLQVCRASLDSIHYYLFNQIVIIPDLFTNIHERKTLTEAVIQNAGNFYQRPYIYLLWHTHTYI